MKIEALSVHASELVAVEDGELDAVNGGLFNFGVKLNLNLNLKKNESNISNSMLVTVGDNATSAIQVEQTIN